MHVDRNSDGAALVGNCPGDTLTDPPGGVGADFVMPVGFEPLDCGYQAEVALLNKVQKWHTPVPVFFGDTDNQEKIGFDKVVSGF